LKKLQQHKHTLVEILFDGCPTAQLLAIKVSVASRGGRNGFDWFPHFMGQVVCRYFDTLRKGLNFSFK
jgi:hypothetical protein